MPGVHDLASELDYLRLALDTSGVEAPELVLPQDHWVTVNGLRFHYLDWAAVDRTPALFLHGAGLTAHTWDLVCLALRQRLHCLAVDARGHGDTQWAPGAAYSRADHVADVEALVAALRLDQFLLVGMSMGGGTAIAYAGQHADGLKALVIVDTGPNAGGSPGARRVRDFMAGPAELDSVEDFVARAMEFNPARDPRLLRRSLLYNLRQLPDGRWTWKYDRRRVAQPITPDGDVEARRAADWESVRQITCPTLVVRGARSDNFSDQNAEELAVALPDGRWRRVENAGHTVQGDNPKGLLEVLRPFLDQVGV
jgi:esterase